MTPDQFKLERRHEYTLALGLMGLDDKDVPTQEQHNAAVARADAHIQSIREQERKDMVSGLRALADSL